MFGIYRFVLSCMVVLAHLWPALTDWTGVYAVFSFYMLSGYLIAFALNESYGFRFSGLLRFLSNRALRIYPPYLVVLVAAIVIVLLIPDAAQRINEKLVLPSGLKGWLHNIFILGLNGDTSRLVPPAWSVDVALFFYFSMAILLVRDRRITVLWFATSLAITLFMLVSQYGFNLRYASILGASLPFSVGAMIFHFRQKFMNMSKWNILIASVLFVLHAISSKVLWNNPRSMGFYLSLFISIYLQTSLGSLRRKNMPSWIVKTDEFLGNLSYPVFLCHWHVASIIASLGFLGVSDGGGILFFLSLPWINLAAYLINFSVEKPISKIRSRIRSHGRLGA